MTDNVNGGTLSFSDGTSITVTGIPNDGASKVVFFPNKDVTWVKFQGSGGSGPNVGLSEFEVFATEAINTASSATVTSSTYYENNDSYAPGKVMDGIIGMQDDGEWASNGEKNPWIQLTWPEANTIGKVVLYDRINLLDNANGGNLTFSDGSSMSITGIPADGSPLVITFPSKSVIWVKFELTEGTGVNVGLSEIKVGQ